MIIAGIILFILFFIFYILFVSKTFSPIPYFPSNHKDHELIMKALDLNNNQVVIDLGAGDGWIIFEAARVTFEKKLQTKFIAVEINPALIIIMQIRKLLHPNGRNIVIKHGDIFKMDYSTLQAATCNLSPTIYIYISPWFIDQVLIKIQKELPAARIVSYYYPVKPLKAFEEHKKGIHDVFVYNKV